MCVASASNCKASNHPTKHCFHHIIFCLQRNCTCKNCLHEGIALGNHNVTYKNCAHETLFHCVHYRIRIESDQCIRIKTFNNLISISNTNSLTFRLQLMHQGWMRNRNPYCVIFAILAALHILDDVAYTWPQKSPPPKKKNILLGAHTTLHSPRQHERSPTHLY